MLIWKGISSDDIMLKCYLMVADQFSVLELF